MRSVLFGAALLLGTAAIAQPPADDTTDDTTMTTTTDTTTEMSQPASTTTTTSTTMQTTGGVNGGGMVAPGNTRPATDARGIPVISAPAVAPQGWNGNGPPAPASGPAPSMGAATDLPPCSRTVTDRCVQTYERGRAPR
ncbi:MAG: hypothetical protein QOI38_783 [Sphingomonadales bacterium]|jgi:hypothetical protein|nr:hypothetical protein [Sphingomonadales bacterium]